MNRLDASVVAVNCEASLALVEVELDNGTRLTAMMAGGAGTFVPGARVTAGFKSAEVSLAKGALGRISLRNRLVATIDSLDLGRLMARVTLDCDGHKIVSLITARAASDLELAPGDAVTALIKANELSLWIEAGDGPC